MRHLVVASFVAIAVLTGEPRPAAGAFLTDDACALLTPADIAKTISWKVGAGAAGSASPGTFGKCTWTTAEGTRVIVTLTDTRHAQITINAWEGAGGKDVPGLGVKAVSSKAADITGGYIVTVQDAKGGFGVSVLGRSATADNPIALAKIVESRR
jgi:hypothetical protein